ncbi:Predicted arabinose efflux permease, MFS family [Amphritea atlantica]|uniref:Predicted arabinose efflux permease, MFS family n=1 Tax=Amphritea atlantica TaxID=355243 RepID=A0A1H9FVS1_9GAMM|nr:MFS transporter [Amphritea atlantica]SEQ41937.1 Predicted arabinose efflux permease, MFS family [Amphritea atlantica]
MDNQNQKTIRTASGRREGILIALGSSLTIMGSVMVAPMLPKMGMEFGPTHPQADMLLPLAITGPALAIAICAPLAGWLSDRTGRKNMLIIATLLYAILGVLPAFLNGLDGVVISRLLFGCAEAAIMTCCTALIADYWHAEERLKFVNMQVVCIGLVGSAFFVIGGVLGEQSWRLPFYLYLLPLLLIPFFMRVLWEPKHHEVQQITDTTSRVATLPLIVGYSMIMFGMVLNFIVPIQAPSLLVSIGVVSTTKIGLAAGLSLLATLAGSLLWPVFRSSFGIAGCNALLMALIAVGLWFLAHANTYNKVMIAVTIHGIGAGMMVPNIMATIMNALPASVRGRGIGGFTSCLYLGQFISPIIVGIVISFGVDLPGAIVSLAMASAVVAAIWLIFSLVRRNSGADLAAKRAA